MQGERSESRMGLSKERLERLIDRSTDIVVGTDSHGTAMADFPTARFDPFFNVNTPEDLARARGRNR